MNVYDKSHELARTLRESQEYREFKKISGIVLSNSTNKEMIKDFKKKIMVTHAHPVGSTMEKFSDFVPGSTSVREAIDKFKPDFLLCSHVHEAEGIEEKIGKTRVINVGKSGKIIEI